MSSNNPSCDAVAQHPIGLGTLNLERDQVLPALRSAILTAGYRRIDCAPVYFNEDVIGDALHDILSSSSRVIQREDLFVVSKCRTCLRFRRFRSRNADVALARHIITPLLENAHLHFYWNLVYQNIRWKSLLTCQLSRLEI